MISYVVSGNPASAMVRSVAPIGFNSSKMTSNKAFVDQHHASGASVVEIVEVAAGPYRDLQRVEVAGTDVRESRRIAIVSSDARDPKEMSPHLSAQRNVRRRSRCGDAGHRADFAGELLLTRKDLLGWERGGREIQERDRE